MARIRKRHSPAFKAQVALEAAKQTKTIVSFRQACKTRPPRLGMGRRPMGVRVANGAARDGYCLLAG